MKRPFFTCLLCSLLALSACGHGQPGRPDTISPAYERLLQALYHNTVPTVPAAALAKALAQPAAPLLLDARTPAEYRVSHLRGARFVNSDSLGRYTFPGLNRSQPVVVYCSVGCRSERLGERLHALGFQHVQNLYGGLFEWVNEGYPVVDSRGPTQNVHPYSALWSPWLKRGRKVYE